MTRTYEVIKTDTCSACGRVEHIDLLDSKDDGSGDYTILQCIACYGDEWLPAVSIVIDDVHCPDLIPHYAAFAINSEKKVRAELYAAGDRLAKAKQALAASEAARKAAEAERDEAREKSLDLLARLRKQIHEIGPALVAKLEAAQARIAALEEALRPFAEAFEHRPAINDQHPDYDLGPIDEAVPEMILYGHLRRAAAALNPKADRRPA